MLKRVYVASSWRNQDQAEVVKLCRDLGFETYDFKNPPNGTGFSWREVANPGRDWKEWNQQEYLEALQHPRAVEGFNSDMDALKSCDICILVFPAGVSAALEFGWAVGAGKRTFIVGMPREADLMVKMSDGYCADLEELYGCLRVIAQGSEVHEVAGV